MPIKTRSQYLAGECTYNEYYSQFVTESLIKYVVKCIGSEKIINSTDEHFNDIPLQYWDRLIGFNYTNGGAFKEANNQTQLRYTLSDNVCLTKHAARIYKERNKQS